MYSDISSLISFRRGSMIETTKLYILISLDDLDLCSRSQLYQKSKTFVSIFLEISVDLDEIQYVATFRWFSEAHAKFILYL